jgi:hypothetical protein
MGKHSTQGQIVLKRDRKLERVYRAMPPQSSLEEHMAKFQEMYPEDWQSLVYRYTEHKRHTPEGQPHAMPEPTQHLLTMVKHYYRKTNKVVARSKREAQPEVVTAHPQPEAQPEAMTEHPQPEAQPEAMTEHSQPEVVTEHPQPEAMTEHSQPPA